MFSSFNVYRITPTQFLDAPDPLKFKLTEQLQLLQSGIRAPHSLPFLLLWEKKNKYFVLKAKSVLNRAAEEMAWHFPNIA